MFGFHIEWIAKSRSFRKGKAGHSLFEYCSRQAWSMLMGCCRYSPVNIQMDPPQIATQAFSSDSLSERSAEQHTKNRGKSRRANIIFSAKSKMAVKNLISSIIQWYFILKCSLQYLLTYSLTWWTYSVTRSYMSGQIVPENSRWPPLQRFLTIW